jgi:CubicO group peptidase (beta-lactamase class C family)
MHFLTTLLLLFVTLPLVAQTHSPEILCKEFEKSHGFEGVVLIAQGNQVLFEQGFGYANREWQIPNSPETKFNIASISKQFTAILTLQLHEQGKLSLEGKISDYLPYYRKDTGSQITIHHLLTHRSGIPNYTSLPNVWEDSLRNHYSLKELIVRFCSHDLEFEPDSQYAYNNSGYLILAAVLEEVTGKPFAKLLRQYILKPLSLHDTGIDVRSEVIRFRATGYIKIFNTYRHGNYTYMRNLDGPGSMYTTVRDLFRYSQALFGGQILSPESQERMFTAYSYGEHWIAPYSNAYGYGIGMANIPPYHSAQPYNMVFHSGHISGFSSFMAHFTDDQLLVVMLSNIGNISTTAMNKLAIALRNAQKGLPYEMPQKTTP